MSAYLGVSTPATRRARRERRVRKWWVREAVKSEESTRLVKASLELDSGPARHEQKREHVAFAHECYTKQHRVPEQVVRDEFEKMLDLARKDSNEGCLNTINNASIPMGLWIRAVNLARMIYVIYKLEDAYTHSSKKLKECIDLLFIKPLQSLIGLIYIYS
ncbi:hypothetical protein Sjap_004283 [Stephania japonica]|uniref:Uncharacterized protein n=1 Tax=Stephania japonica TaxID=461633 RepID=A0AAP0K2Z9_9MAGN